MAAAEGGREGEGGSVAEEGREQREASLADARMRARAREGRLSWAERAGVMVSSFALYKTLRRQRRRLTESLDRFRLSEKERPADTEDSEEARKARLFRDNLSDLEEPPLPAEPPEAEEEAEGVEEERPRPLRASQEWWKEERARQEADPFQAGKAASARFKWRDGLRPVPPSGKYLSWGPSTDTSRMEPAERVVFVKLLAKDVRSGALRLVSWDEVDVVTPAFIARHPVTGKPRLVHDLRAVNVRLVDSTVSLDRAIDALMHGSYAAKLDLAQAFRHVSLHPDDRRCMVFVVDGIPLQWQALPFGAGQSPELFANALAPVIARASHDKATIVVYVDDILVVAHTPEVLDAAVVQLCEGLRLGGWRIALDKAFLYAMGRVPFLGLVVDLPAGVLRVSRHKARRLQDLGEIMLRKQRVSLRDLQRVGGLLAFFAVAAPEAGMVRTGINAATAEAERLPGRSVGVKGRLADDLRFWVMNAKHLPTMTRPAPGTGERWAMATDAAGLPSLGFGGVVWRGGAPTPDIDAALGEVERFAAEVRDGAEAFGGWVFAGPIADALASESSAALEVHAFRAVLRRLVAKVGKEVMRGATVVWYCDAQVAVGAVGKWRAKARGLLRELDQLLEFVRGLGCTVEPHWVAREAGWQPVADYLSKVRWVRDQAEWSLPRDVFNAIVAAASFTPTVDLFATRNSRRLPAYVSRYPEAGNEWTDAFARTWDDVHAYAFPPFSAVPAVLRHMCRSKRTHAVLVVPRTTDVPARLRVVDRRQLAPVRLVDVDGHVAPQPCPVQLDVIEVTSP